MKTFIKTIALMLLLAGVVACSKEDEQFPQQLEVTPNNISGIWYLDEVDGQPLADGLYCYIEFVRRERKFTIYQNFDSMYPRRLTGSFSLTKDDYKGDILSGKYDYGMGEWNSSYIVTGLFDKEMLLAADTVDGEICKYVRCNEVPAEILDWFE